MQILRKRKGFTLLELLIVIAIIAILSVVLILVLDPAETLKKARDAQRIADLSTVKTAIGVYSTTTSTPFMAGASTNVGCKTGAGAGSYGAGSKIWYSFPSDVGGVMADTALDGGSAGTPTSTQTTQASSTFTDGTGWIPINLSGLTSGSPISGWPLDPKNTIANLGAVAVTDLVYRYTCNASTTQYEIDATLESNAYTVADNKATKDGGNNTSTYEVGTNLKLLGSGIDF